MDLDQIGTHAGSGMIGAVIAFLTLKGKVDKMSALHKEAKREMEKAIEEIKGCIHDLKTSIVYQDTCDICRVNSDNQLKAVNEKLDILLERRSQNRE